ncbi:hypothetical protein [Bacillus sp. OV322]|nr:hypothetical protein [Bacillus sp. OV322]
MEHEKKFENDQNQVLYPNPQLNRPFSSGKNTGMQQQKGFAGFFC